MKILTYRNKGQDSNPKKYRDNKPQNKIIPEPKTETNFQARCTDLKDYTFDLGPRASDKFSRTMKELEQYIGVKYSDRCQPTIITETVANFPDLEMPTITDLGIERPKKNGDMT